MIYKDKSKNYQIVWLPIHSTVSPTVLIST